MREQACMMSIETFRPERGVRAMHPLHELWHGMIKRCSCPTATGFANYGGRGIAVCDRWRDFWAFVDDVGERPPGTTLDRIDNERGYEPGNVRWATWSEQCSNTRYNRHLVAHGRSQTLEAWALETGLAKSTIFNRLRRGWGDEAAVTTKPQPKLPDGSLVTAETERVARAHGVSRTAVANRLRRGWTLERALTEPPRVTERRR